MAATTGSLASHPIAQLLGHVVHVRFTGSLEIEGPSSFGEGDAAAVTFADGAIAKMKTKAPIAYLGSVLYELGLIDADELNASLRELAAKKIPQGEILLARGSVSLEALSIGLREQALRKVAHLFGFDGSSTFTLTEHHDVLSSYGAPDPLLVDPRPGIWRGLRDYPLGPEVAVLLARVEPFSCRLSQRACADRFDLQPAELAVLARLSRGPRTLAQLRASGDLPPRMADRLVYCMLVTREIQVVSVDGAVPARAASTSEVRPGVSMPVSARSQTPVVPQLSADLAARAEIISERARSIRGEDFFSRLSVPRDASAAQIRRQYEVCKSLWMALPIELDSLRAETRAILAALAEAFQTLADPSKRGDYVESFLVGGANERARDLAVSGAETALEGAKACVADNDFERAARLARSAHNANADHAEALALLAWAESQLPANQGADATKARIAMLDRALMIDSTSEPALRFRWQLHRRLENHAGAMRDLRRLVALYPDDIGAQRELRIYEMRVRRGSVQIPAVRPEPTGSGVHAKAEPSGLLDRFIKRG